MLIKVCPICFTTHIHIDEIGGYCKTCENVFDKEDAITVDVDTLLFTYFKDKVSLKYKDKRTNMFRTVK